MSQSATLSHDVCAAQGADLRSLGFVAGSGTARIVAGALSVGRNVKIHDGVTLCGDKVVIGDDVEIGPETDLRSGIVDIGANSLLDGHSTILVTDRFALGRAGRIRRRADIACRSFEAGRLLYLENHFTIGGGGTLSTRATVSIGHRVALGAHTLLNAARPVTLEDQVGSGDFLSIWTSGYHFGHRILEGFGSTFAPVHVGRNAWLAHHVTILPGCTVGADSIVGAGAVVTKDVPAAVLAAGAPAGVKRGLEFRAIAADEAERAVGAILRRWGAEMEWKGWGVDFIDAPDGGFRIRIAAPSGRRAGLIVLLPAGGHVSECSDHDFVVIVSLDPDAPPSRCEHSACALLNVVRGFYSGSSFDVAEDLRDFLRRETLPCGDDRRFHSIEPLPVARLKAMTP